jgi:hypothetical protein
LIGGPRGRGASNPFLRFLLFFFFFHISVFLVVMAAAMKCDASLWVSLVLCAGRLLLRGWKDSSDGELAACHRGGCRTTTLGGGPGPLALPTAQAFADLL